MNPISIQITFSGKTRLFTLADALITVGSDPKSTLVLPFPWITPQHLEIEHGLLLSRVRCPSQNSPATLDGYPITGDWSILPRHGVIEIPSPMGAKLTIAVDLQPVPVAAEIAAASSASPPPQVPFSAPMDVSLRVDRASQSDGVLMKYIPLAIAALLLLGIVAVLFIINNQNPPPPPAVTIVPPAPPPTTPPNTTEETPATAPVISTKPTTAPSTNPLPTTAPTVAIPPSSQSEIVPKPATRVSGRRQVTTTPTTGPSQYALLDDETHDLLSHPTAAPLKSDLLRSSAYEQAQLAVTARLKNASLQFPTLDSGEVLIDFHDGLYIVRGHFNSTNSAGIPLRQLFFCKLRPAEHHWEIVQTEIFSG